MDTEAQVKQQVREFYNQVGWQEQSDGFYQNAIYEDLRPVAGEYVHKCHLRVLRHLNLVGHLLLDAGSGPIQYPEYLEYSRGYQQRVCADISRVALEEARKRIGDHGLYVVCDVARLPFKKNAFDGVVSLHTLHHLPPKEHVRAYQELYRTLAPAGKAVVVNGWDHPPMTVFLDFWIGLINRLYAARRREPLRSSDDAATPGKQSVTNGRGTYIHKETAKWLQQDVGSQLPIQIWCWRSISVRAMRALIHPKLGGKLLLKILFWKEELFPHLFGKLGQYPLVVITKNG